MTRTLDNHGVRKCYNKDRKTHWIEVAIMNVRSRWWHFETSQTKKWINTQIWNENCIYPVNEAEHKERTDCSACWLYKVQVLLTNNARSKMRTTFVIPNSNDAICWMESSLCFGASIPWHILTSEPSWQTYYLRVQQRSHLLWMNEWLLSGMFL